MSPRSTGGNPKLDKSTFPVRNPKLLILSALFVVLFGTTGVGQTRRMTMIEPGTAAEARIQRSNLLAVSQSRVMTITADLPGATSGTAYNALISVAGGVAPYRFSISRGTLPSGLSLNATTGSISGTPAGSGTYKFVALVNDRLGRRADKAMQISVAGSGSAAISVAVSPTGATLQSGGTQQFWATVQNTSQTGVTWAASAGSVTASGLFTAPKVSGTALITVTATSVADKTKKASASVSVTTAPPPPPPPPSGSLAVVTTAVPGATSGSAYSATLMATGGQQPYQWSITSGSLPNGLQLNSTSGLLSGTTSAQGQFNFTAQVKDAAATTATQAMTLVVSSQPTGGKFDGPAELPRVYVQSQLANTPANGSTIFVPAGGNLQAALNAANCGDTISLQAGGTFPGNFTFPKKSCDDQHWIIVRTSAPDSALPPEGTRLTPCYAGVASLPGRPPFNCRSTQKVVATILMSNLTGSGPVRFADGANHYRLLGLEITRPPTGTTIFSLAAVVPGGAMDHIVYDRVWVHGTAHDETQNGIKVTGARHIAVVDSFLNDMHCVSRTGACTDGNAIGGGIGWRQAGPIKVVNNFLEAGGQCFFLGGGAASQTPADIEIRRNHLFKPLIWKSGQPGFVGAANGNPFVVKNHFELKNAQRVLFEGNILENVWGGFSQNGFFVLLTPKNQSNQCPLCQVTDVTIRYSTFSHGAAGMQIANGASDSGGLPLDGERYSIHDVTMDDVNGPKYVGSGNIFMIGMAQGAPNLQKVTINHVTAFANNAIMAIRNSTTNPKMSTFSFTNNLLEARGYAILSTGGGTGNCAYTQVPLTVFNSCYNPYAYTGNALIGAASKYQASQWPSGNMIVGSASTVDFVNYSNGNGGNYALLSSSPYKNKATDGKDIGADIALIMSTTAGVY